jgi:type IV pilus assembly protein PilM
MASLNSAWGIDIGNRALKAVRLVRTGEGVRVADVEIIEHEHILSQAGDNKESLIHSALANFAQRRSGRNSVAVGVSGQSSFARFIKLPPVEPKKIPEIVRFEAIQQIPFPLDDVEWSYQLFQNPQSPDVEVGIFAMRRELVNRHIQFFIESGLNVELVQMNPLAVYNAMHHDGRLKGTTMIVDLGAENTDLIIAEGETIWLRSISIGGNNFTEALVKSFKLKFPKAEELKRNAATSKYGRQILQAMRPVFADLVAEIQRSIGFYASVHRDSRIERVIALGGTFRLPGLQKYLQQNLQMDVARIDRLGDTSGLDAKAAAVYSDNLLSSVSAYGLALQALGEATINSSLLPQKIRRERMWREKAKWFAGAAALFVVGTGVAYGSYYYRHLQDEKDVQSYGDKIRNVLREATDYDTQWKAVSDGGVTDRAQIETLRGLVAGRNVWSDLIRDVVSTLPPGPSSPKELQAMAAVPRGQRTQVVLQDFSQHYVPDLTGILAMGDADFANQAGGDSGFRHGGFSPPPPPAAAANGAPATPLRGYLVKLDCVTPNAGGAAYVNSTVLTSLRRLGDTEAANYNPASPPTYRIQRAVVVLARKVGMGAGPMAPRPQPRPLDTGGFPNGNAGGAPAPVDPFSDPLIPSESTRDDTEVTLLVAVVLDPPPPAPAQPAPGAAPAPGNP